MCVWVDEISGNGEYFFRFGLRIHKRETPSHIHLGPFINTLPYNHPPWTASSTSASPATSRLAKASTAHKLAAWPTLRRLAHQPLHHHSHLLSSQALAPTFLPPQLASNFPRLSASSLQPCQPLSPNHHHLAVLCHPHHHEARCRPRQAANQATSSQSKHALSFKHTSALSIRRVR